MAILAELALHDGEGKPIPVYVGVHDRFKVRLHFCRSIPDLQRQGFHRPSDEKAEDEWTTEEWIRIKVERAFRAGFNLVGIGRAEDGESADEATEAVLAFENRISRPGPAWGA